MPHTDDNRPLLRLAEVRMAWRPTPLYVVQQRLEWGPRWLHHLLPYRAASGLHSRPQDACAEAFERFLLFGQPELAAAVTQLDTHTATIG